MRKLIISIFCLAAGCGLNYDPIPMQDKIMQIVWYGVYYRNDSPPQIEWKKQSDLDCGFDTTTGVPYAFYRMRWFGDHDVSGNCVAGVYWSDYDVMQVAIPDNWKLSKTAIAHELLHGALNRVGLYDPDHLQAAWGTSQGKTYNLYDEAQDALRANDL